MSESEDLSQPKTPGSSAKGYFPATHWTQIVAINDPAHPRAEEELDKLCRTYLGAIEAYLRGRRYLPGDPKELANDFLAHFIHHDSLKRVDPDKGKFRHYLAQSLRNYLNNEHRSKIRQRAEVEFDEEIQAGTEDKEMGSSFDRTFAETMISSCIAKTRERFLGTRIEPFLPSLLPFVVSEPQDGVLQEIASARGVTRDVVYQNFRRLRLELKNQLREHARRIIGPDDDVDQEIRELIRAYSRRDSGV